MGTIYQEEYRMAFAGHQPQQCRIPDLESSSESMSGYNSLEDASIQALEVAPPGEEAVLSLHSRNIMDAVDSRGGREDKGEGSRPVTHYPEEPKLMSVGYITATEDASGWILEVAREEEAVLSLDDRDIIDTADSYGNDYDDNAAAAAAADNQGS